MNVVKALYALSIEERLDALQKEVDLLKQAIKPPEEPKPKPEPEEYPMIGLWTFLACFFITAFGLWSFTH